MIEHQCYVTRAGSGYVCFPCIFVNETDRSYRGLNTVSIDQRITKEGAKLLNYFQPILANPLRLPPWSLLTSRNFLLKFPAIRSAREVLLPQLLVQHLLHGPLTLTMTRRSSLPQVLMTARLREIGKGRVMSG